MVPLFATEFVLQSNRFKICCSADGYVHVCVEELCDADILDNQVVKAFGGQSNIWRDVLVAEDARSTRRAHQKSFAIFCKTYKQNK